MAREVLSGTYGGGRMTDIDWTASLPGSQDCDTHSHIKATPSILTEMMKRITIQDRGTRSDKDACLLNSLPLEIMEIVASHLSPQDLGSLRMTCCEMEQKTFAPFQQLGPQTQKIVEATSQALNDILARPMRDFQLHKLKSLTFKIPQNGPTTVPSLSPEAYAEALHHRCPNLSSILVFEVSQNDISRYLLAVVKALIELSPNVKQMDIWLNLREIRLLDGPVMGIFSRSESRKLRVLGEQEVQHWTVRPTQIYTVGNAAARIGLEKLWPFVFGEREVDEMEVD